MTKVKSSPRTDVSFGVVILAAGLGKRMRSARPKVLHLLSGKPLLYHVLKRVREVALRAPIAIVVGHGRESVEAYVTQEPEFEGMDITFILQADQRGTGHAARCASDSPWGEACARKKLPILVLPGDLPLISSQLIAQIVKPLNPGEGMRLLTCELNSPTGYGRIVRKGEKGPVLKIVEEKDATQKEKAIREVAVSIYFFESEYLKSSLRQLSTRNAQNEYYLTDTVGFARKGNGTKKVKSKVGVLTWEAPDDVRGVNDLWELAQAEQMMNERILRNWALQGVNFSNPSSIQMDVTVELAEGVVVHSGAILLGTTRVGRGTVIGPRVVLKDVEVGEAVNLKTGTIAEQVRIGQNAQVGPYAHLRPETVVGSRTKVGNFVELKKTRIGDHSSVAHLSYLGDAEVGSRVNIGCGFVTCNYDGKRKHQTVIEDEVFLGSDCQTVAPVKIGKGAYVASGSTITEDVPPKALAIARSRQVNKLGYAEKLRER